VIVFLTTYADFKDRTTVLKKYEGQHTFIEHTSVISYADAQLVTIESIKAAIDAGEFVFCDSVFPKEELDRIVAGVLGSPRTDRELKRYLIQQHHATR